MAAYYNEIDPFCAEWLRRLIARELITPGEVDERPIEDVQPGDLRGFTRCHFFAGIAGWDLALALAGWPDSAPVWTGSCPCQPFSVAGKGKGFDDERHLWPAWRDLIRECRPPIVFGEQTESADGWTWLGSVRADLEDAGYAVGTACLPAAGIGAPHCRHRLWFVADAAREGRVGRRALRMADAMRSGLGEPPECHGEPHPGIEAGKPGDDADGRRDFRRLGDARRARGRGYTGAVSQEKEEGSIKRGQPGDQPDEPFASGASGRLGGPGRSGSQERPQPEERRRALRHERSASGAASAWGAVDWIPCSDGKARPVEAGTFPLAPRLPGDVGKLRAFGNAIVPQVAAEFIGAYMETE